MPDINVLYLSYDGLTDPLGQSQVLPYLEGLSHRGYAITIISFEKKENLALHEKEVVMKCRHSRLEWVPLRYHKRPPVLSTLFDLWQLKRAVSGILKKRPVRIIHCRSYITSLIGLAMKRKHQVRFVFDMRGFWADERVDGGLWKLDNPLYRMIYRFFKKKELEFFDQADMTVSLTENAKHVIRSMSRNAVVSVIPCCVDLEIFDPDKIAVHDRLRLRTVMGFGQDDFVLLYLGSWGTWYMTGEMLAYFRMVKNLQPNARFLILSGDRVDLEKFEYRKDVTIKKVSRADVPRYIGIADGAVCFIKPAFSKKASSATKMGELLAMNIPVVTNEGWGDVEYYKKSLAGLMVISPDDETSVTRSIQALLTTGNPQSTRNWVTTHLSLANGVELYDRIYRRVAGL